MWCACLAVTEAFFHHRTGSYTLGRRGGFDTALSFPQQEDILYSKVIDQPHYKQRYRPLAINESFILREPTTITKDMDLCHPQRSFCAYI